MDDVLAALDAGLQSSPESDLYNDVAPSVGTGCVRCPSEVVEVGGELCGGCRAFLLGDSDTDPAAAASSPGVDCDGPCCNDDHPDREAFRARWRPVTGGRALSAPRRRAAEVGVAPVGERSYVVIFDDSAVWPVRFPPSEGGTVTYDGASDTYWPQPVVQTWYGVNGPVPAPPESAADRGRRIERQLLDQRRRQQRRTNRWGTP